MCAVFTVVSPYIVKEVTNHLCVCVPVCIHFLIYCYIVSYAHKYVCILYNCFSMVLTLSDCELFIK